MSDAMANATGHARDFEMIDAARAESAAIAGRNSPIVHDHADVLGVKISAIDMALAVDLAQRWIERGNPGYVCLAGVHGVMEAQHDPELLRIFNHAAIAAPDGMPMTWVGRLQGFTKMDRVFGPDFMLEMCRISIERGYRNFLYGGKPGVAQLLGENLQRRFPGLQVAGTYTPPFRSLSPQEENDLAAHVRQLRPHILWVGLSTPKQERFMAQYAGRLEVPLLAGVGAAFDFHTGGIRDCPHWIKRAGLQWAHRLMQEPQRLWKRYLVNNPAFLFRIAVQLAGLQRR
jgi:N-acetylglucosaminyldiphosphoundecaprenol N-acetyl-beta-D-mannosaminyltransferase